MDEIAKYYLLCARRLTLSGEHMMIKMLNGCWIVRVYFSTNTWCFVSVCVFLLFVWLSMVLLVLLFLYYICHEHVGCMAWWSMLAVWHVAYLGSNKSGSISMGWFKLLHSPPFYIPMHLLHILPHIIAHILYMIQMCLIKVIKIPAIRKCENCGHFERERRALHSTARLYKLT